MFNNIQYPPRQVYTFVYAVTVKAGGGGGGGGGMNEATKRGYIAMVRDI